MLKAEKRFVEADGYGRLFTNGTGTDSSFSSLLLSISRALRPLT